MVMNLIKDTHRMPYDYATMMCMEITRSGRVYKPTALAAKPSSSEPTPAPPTKQLAQPPTVNNPTQPSTSSSSTTT